EAYGAIDELNSAVGFARAEIAAGGLVNEKAAIDGLLREIQWGLMNIGSLLAGGLDDEEALPESKGIEEVIDSLSRELPGISNFVIPGGSREASAAHLARAICRRAERRVISLSRREPVPGEVIAYINRLSDFLFVLARYLNHRLGCKEEIWKF
ncbi:MAG: cob(I)yrinic acid a,c-diamide adenosyltransferase, partial [Deltaproteobacteria bacterium]|nr:cob(I)yrinic acid a,c-diamide adenosyltransferase [Deltaproteobacteria bacterium]